MFHEIIFQFELIENNRKQKPIRRSGVIGKVLHVDLRPKRREFSSVVGTALVNMYLWKRYFISLVPVHSDVNEYVVR